ncbi:MAG: ATPase component of various ABC-type transport system, containing duplicated ATPase [Aeromicrobium sp.]|nr:ATPase component of various ABC-type transport system, containing duplicated ATPase [Aeromicrobium sp.]
MTPHELITNYPVLHHMAEYDSWPKIQAIGLRTTAQIVEACNPDATVGDAILGQRRPHSFELEHPVVGTVTVRDQKPLFLHNLELTDVTVEGFLDLLNSRVFMWTHPDRLSRLLGASAYRDSKHDVLVLDTASLVDEYGDSIRLTGMNTGATIFPNSPPRGAESFMTISDFPFVERGRSLVDNVVELCVIGGVDNVEDHTIRVEQRKGLELLDTVYQR